jgi:hypothetical protein
LLKGTINESTEGDLRRTTSLCSKSKAQSAKRTIERQKP